MRPIKEILRRISVAGRSDLDDLDIPVSKSSVSRSSNVNLPRKAIKPRQEEIIIIPSVHAIRAFCQSLSKGLDVGPLQGFPQKEITPSVHAIQNFHQELATQPEKVAEIFENYINPLLHPMIKDILLPAANFPIAPSVRRYFYEVQALKEGKNQALDSLIEDPDNLDPYRKSMLEQAAWTLKRNLATFQYTLFPDSKIVDYPQATFLTALATAIVNLSTGSDLEQLKEAAKSIASQLPTPQDHYAIQHMYYHIFHSSILAIRNQRINCSEKDLNNALDALTKELGQLVSESAKKRGNASGDTSASI